MFGDSRGFGSGFPTESHGRLKTFLPNPPNTIFPNRTAIILPEQAIQRGMPGGRERLNKVPVTKTAEVTGFLEVNNWKTYSVINPVKLTASRRIRLCQPKKYREASMIGIRL